MSQVDKYISGNMPEGLTVKEALDRIAKYSPDSFVWTEIPNSVTVDLNDITSCPNITGPGDYTIFSFTNAPEGVTSIPLNVSIRKADSSDELALFIFDGLKQFIKEGASAWSELPSYDTNVLSIFRGDNPPDDTKLYWLDTSHYADGEGYIDMKYYNGTEWVSIFNSPELMFTTTYDGAANASDMYKYIRDLIIASNKEVSKFDKHINNLLPLFHISDEKYTEFNSTILTAAEVTNMINTTYRAQLRKVVDDTIESETHAKELVEKITTATDDFSQHLNTHMTDADADRWNGKAKADHTHLHDENVTIYGEDIYSGAFKAEKIPDEVKERYYKITSLDELGDSAITDEERTLKYHNGNAFYMATGENDSDGYPKYKWFRVVDQTKIGTPDYMEGLLEFTNELQPLTWELIVDRPTTLAEYGLDDEAYTKAETDEVIAPAKEKYAANKAVAESWVETVDIASTAGLVPPSGKQINRVGIQFRIDNPTENDDMCEGSYVDVIAYLNDGTVYKTRLTKNPETGRFIHLGFSWVKIHNADYTYFSNRFPSSYTEDSRNPKFATSGCGRCWYAASTDTTTEIALPDLFDWPYVMTFNTSGITFKIPKPNALESIAEINAAADFNYRQIATKLDEVYQKWGYPADVPDEQINPKLIESPVTATLAMGVESVSMLPQLIYIPPKPFDRATAYNVHDSFTLGKYQVADEDPWDIQWDIVHLGDGYQIAMASSILDCLPFDAKEPDNPIANRQTYGNNIFKLANIAQWLESSAAAGEWYSPQHEYDTPPSTDLVSANPYDTKPGFLYYWTDEEKSLLQTFDLTLAFPTDDIVDEIASYTLSRKVFLPTYTQLFGNANGTIMEGFQFNAFSDNASRIRKLHPMCAAHNAYCVAQSKVAGAAWHYRMASAFVSSRYRVRFVITAGTTHNANAYNGAHGLVPCIVLPR